MGLGTGMEIAPGRFLLLFGRIFLPGGRGGVRKMNMNFSQNDGWLM